MIDKVKDKNDPNRTFYSTEVFKHIYEHVFESEADVIK